ncbi:MAG: HDIG domain-containing protein, partial [Treponema sp.]|nr:HDIG domain-containing protein [Treponema sp.]
MKNNPKRLNILTLLRSLIPHGMRRGPALAWLAALFLCLVVILANHGTSRHAAVSFLGEIDEFEAGMVAHRDVIADHTITYIDEYATRLRLYELMRLSPAVFRQSDRVTVDIMSRWNQLAGLIGEFSRQELHLEDASPYLYPPNEHSPYAYSLEAFVLAIELEFPGYFPHGILQALYESEDRFSLLQSAQNVLSTVLERGIVFMPHTGLEHLNQDFIELIRVANGRFEQERLPIANIVTRATVMQAVASQIALSNHPAVFSHIAPALLSPFLLENAFFSPEDTEQRLAFIQATAEPVLRTIEQGQRIIQRGFIITEEEMAELAIVLAAIPEDGSRPFFADSLFLILIFAFIYYFCGSRLIDRKLKDSEIYLIIALSTLYISGSVLVRNAPIYNFPDSVIVPTALVMLLPSILIHPRLALVLAMTLPLGAFLTGSFDAASFIFALVSGVVAAYSLQGAEKRMDLVRAGLIVAAANVFAMVAVLLWQQFPAGVYPQALFWAAFNGIASGMLVLGVLPPLENALNASTSFRLIELSDLNAPVLRKLFTTAPGTYSHSIMVANLAEAACMEIKANPLLARVGAYYHDLGKMENPDYFVENQTDYNRHDYIAPRLSATVIRSHVKLGVEKARQLGLPREVLDIIGEHHGNSVISWFYDKALKQEGKNGKNAPVNIEDFSYPGTPPRSRESAVVMLADVTEAAVRTLNKPTAVKIEKFTEELIAKKVAHGQLAQSELTFVDVEKIKNVFVRVLVAYYHSRIEYPKTVDVQAAA